MSNALRLSLLGALISASHAGCSASHGAAPTPPFSGDKQSWESRLAEPLAAGLQQPRAETKVSAAFKAHWRDGRAELSGYRVKTMRYGAPREGTRVLIYVTEPIDRRTWIKDESGRAGPHRVDVLKLNSVLRFRTGIYDYSVMTSVFSPVDRLGRERFAPGKISLTVQDWCGQVYHQIHPKGTHFHSELHSYFESEGNKRETVPTPAGVLYEDALLIQLRELDGAFAGGDATWRGAIVPSLWTARKRHEPARPEEATISRADASRDGVAVTRFTVRFGGVERTYEIEKAAPRRVLGWKGSDGEEGSLIRTSRLPYWQLNSPEHDGLVRELGL